MSGLRITGDDDGQRFEVRGGDVVGIRLEELGATGYEWELGQLDTKAVTLERNEFVPPSERIPGAPGTRKVDLRARAAGTAAIQLRYRRQWETQAAAQRFQIVITVRD